MTPPLRFIAPLRFEDNVHGKENYVTLPFTLPLQVVTPLRFRLVANGKTYYDTLSLTPPLRFAVSHRFEHAADGNENDVTLTFIPPLRCITPQRFGYGVNGKTNDVTIRFMPPLRFAASLRLEGNVLGNENYVTLTFIPPSRFGWGVSGKVNHVKLCFTPVRNYRHGLIRYRYDAQQFHHSKQLFRFDYRNYIGTKLSFLYDYIVRMESKTAWKYDIFVRPGWRIIAKNLANGNSKELGFIDADNSKNSSHSLTDIYLPDGDYEISVLTSSLYWQDTIDTNIRTISVRSGEEISPLPVIYNLRSAISQGTTVIEWSANQSEIDDCLFALWYSTETPVDTTRPPDTTVWYDPSQTEYRTTFYQNAPAYLAVTAMRPGNEPEFGKIHALFLDWNSVPPRAPDDVMIFDTPLPAINTNISTNHQDDPTLTLW
jgi:hypothetical protein